VILTHFVIKKTQAHATSGLRFFDLIFFVFFRNTHPKNSILCEIMFFLTGFWAPKSPRGGVNAIWDPTAWRLSHRHFSFCRGYLTCCPRGAYRGPYRVLQDIKKSKTMWFFSYYALIKWERLLFLGCLMVLIILFCQKNIWYFFGKWQKKKSSRSAITHLFLP